MASGQFIADDREWCPESEGPGEAYGSDEKGGAGLGGYEEGCEHGEGEVGMAPEPKLRDAEFLYGGGG